MKIISIDCATKTLGVCILKFDILKINQIKEIINAVKGTKNYKKILKKTQQVLDKLISELKILRETLKEPLKDIQTLQEQKIIKIKNDLEIIKKQMSDIKLQSLHNLYLEICNIEYADVIDIIPNERIVDTTFEFRSARVAGVVSYLKSKCPDYDYVLLEYQMSVNDKSKSVCNQLISGFSYPDFGFVGYNTNKDNKDNKIITKIPKVVIVGCSIKNQIAFSDELSYENYLSNTEKRYLANKNHCKDNFVEFCKKSNQIEKIKSISKKVLKDVGDAFMMGYVWFMRNCV